MMLTRFLSQISGSNAIRGFALMIIGALLLVLSWPATGSFWPFILVGFLPLFVLNKLCVQREITTIQHLLFSAGTFFLWNAGVINFLFFIDHNIGVRLMAFLTPVMINTLWMTFSARMLLRVSKFFGMHSGIWVFILVWLIFEWIQHHSPLAFPWLTLGNVLGDHPQWMQWYTFTGVGGGSLWVLLVNYLLWWLLTDLPRNFQKRSVAVFGISVVALPLVWSYWNYHEKHSDTDMLGFTIVQPCLDLADEKFDESAQLATLTQMLESAAYQATQRDIVVLPETAIYEPGSVHGSPGHLRFYGMWINDPSGSQTLDVLRDYQGTQQWSGVVSGTMASKFYSSDEDAPAYAQRIPQLDAHVEYFNSAVVLSNDSLKFRHKTVLVAGVEQIPFAHIFPWLNQWAVDLGGVVGTLGSAETSQPTKINQNQLAVQICYDSAFGWLAARQARQGAEVLLVLTNDAWWGDTPGYKQLLSFTRIRAVETGRAVVRSANNGVSAFVSPKGEITGSLAWNVRGAIRGDVLVNTHQTLYTLWGDYVYLGAAILLPLLILFGYAMNKSKQ